MKKKSFRDRVLEIVAGIPKGKTCTYAQVAKKAGSPRAARSVGTMMAKNFNPEIPCHRVVRSGGAVGEYNQGGPVEKRRLLQEERALS